MDQSLTNIDRSINWDKIYIYPKKIKCFFSSSYMYNNFTGLVFFFFGVIVVLLTSLVLYFIRSLRDNDKDYLKFEEFIEWIRTQFCYGYFIRLYQITMMKNFLSITLLFIYGTDAFQIIIGVFFLVFWLFGFPIFLFVTLRTNQINIMSEEIIKSHGALFLNYRGITKDVYAMLLHLKIMCLPIIAVIASNFPKAQLMMLSILFFTNLLFISFSMPFNKVNKVFSEAVSEGILMFFFVGTYVIEVLDTKNNLKDSNYVKISFTGVLFSFFFIRFFNSLVNMISRVKDLILFKQRYDKYLFQSSKLNVLHEFSKTIKPRRKDRASLKQDSDGRLKPNQTLSNMSSGVNESNSSQILNHSIIINSFAKDTKGHSNRDDLYSHAHSNEEIHSNFSNLIKESEAVISTPNPKKDNKNEENNNSKAENNKSIEQVLSKIPEVSEAFSEINKVNKSKLNMRNKNKDFKEKSEINNEEKNEDEFEKSKKDKIEKDPILDGNLVSKIKYSVINSNNSREKINKIDLGILEESVSCKYEKKSNKEKNSKKESIHFNAFKEDKDSEKKKEESNMKTIEFKGKTSDKGSLKSKNSNNSGKLFNKKFDDLEPNSLIDKNDKQIIENNASNSNIPLDESNNNLVIKSNYLKNQRLDSINNLSIKEKKKEENPINQDIKKTKTSN